MAILEQMSSAEQDDSGSHGEHSLFEIVREAAIEAEYETGEREETEAEARRHVMFRLLRVLGGFTIIGLGIAALPLPGPGWLIIIVGLEMLPFVWAERTIRLIRRKIPGVPEEGRIPARTWVVMGVLVLAFSTLSYFYADDVRTLVASSWGDPDRLIG